MHEEPEDNQLEPQPLPDKGQQTNGTMPMPGAPTHSHTRHCSEGSKALNPMTSSVCKHTPCVGSDYH